MQNYFELDFNGKKALFRVNGSLINDVTSIEIYNNGIWSTSLRIRQFIMNKVVTGWLDDDDAIEFSEAIKISSSKIEMAKQLALEYHGDQRYGDRLYEFHLNDVIQVLNENAISSSNEFYIDLHVIAWLHDVLEDTNIDPKIISNQFGAHVLTAVQALSDGEGKNRTEKKAAMMKNLVLNQSAMIVKLADRISNVRISIQDANEKKLSMYKAENASFTAHIENSVETKEGELLLRHLRSILN